MSQERRDSQPAVNPNVDPERVSMDIETVIRNIAVAMSNSHQIDALEVIVPLPRLLIQVGIVHLVPKQAGSQALLECCNNAH